MKPKDRIVSVDIATEVQSTCVDRENYSWLLCNSPTYGIFLLLLLLFLVLMLLFLLLILLLLLLILVLPTILPLLLLFLLLVLMLLMLLMILLIPLCSICILVHLLALILIASDYNICLPLATAISLNYRRKVTMRVVSIKITLLKWMTSAYLGTIVELSLFCLTLSKTQAGLQEFSR